MVTKNGIGNLINKYTAVLKKCHLLNTFGTLAVAGMLVASTAGLATATVLQDAEQQDPAEDQWTLPEGGLTIDTSTSIHATDDPDSYVVNFGNKTLTLNGGLTLAVPEEPTSAFQFIGTGGTLNIGDGEPWLGGNSLVISGIEVTNAGRINFGELSFSGEHGETHVTHDGDTFVTETTLALVGGDAETGRDGYDVSLTVNAGKKLSAQQILINNGAATTDGQNGGTATLTIKAGASVTAHEGVSVTGGAIVMNGATNVPELESLHEGVAPIEIAPPQGAYIKGFVSFQSTTNSGSDDLYVTGFDNLIEGTLYLGQGLGTYAHATIAGDAELVVGESVVIQGNSAAADATLTLDGIQDDSTLRSDVDVFTGTVNLTGSADSTSEARIAYDVNVGVQPDDSQAAPVVAAGSAVLNMKDHAVLGAGLDINQGGVVNVTTAANSGAYIRGGDGGVVMTDADAVLNIGTASSAGHLTIGLDPRGEGGEFAGLLNVDAGTVNLNNGTLLLGSGSATFNSGATLTSTGTSRIDGAVTVTGTKVTLYEGELAVNGHFSMGSSTVITESLYVGQYDEANTQALQVNGLTIVSEELPTLLAVTNSQDHTNFVGGTATHTMDVAADDMKVGGGTTFHADMLTIEGIENSGGGYGIGGTLSTNVLTTDSALTLNAGAVQVRGTADLDKAVFTHAMTASGVSLQEAPVRRNVTPLTTSPYIVLGYTGQSAEHGGTTGAALTADNGGTITVQGGTWKTSESHNVTIGAGGIFGISTDATLDVSPSTLSVDAQAELAQNNGNLIAQGKDFIGEGGKVTLTTADAAITGTLETTDSKTVYTSLAGDGTLTLTGLTADQLGITSLTGLTVAQNKAITDALKGALLAQDSTGAVLVAGLEAKAQSESISNVGSGMFTGEITAGEMLEGQKVVMTGVVLGDKPVEIPRTAELKLIFDKINSIMIKSGFENFGSMSITGGTDTAAAVQGISSNEKGASLRVTSLVDFSQPFTNQGIVTILGKANYYAPVEGAGLMLAGDALHAASVSFQKWSAASKITVLSDPAWQTDASLNTIEKTANVIINDPTVSVYESGMNIVVGRNAFGTFGMDEKAAQAMFNASNYTWGNPADNANNISAAVFIGKPVDLSTQGGRIVADGTLTGATNDGSTPTNFAYHIDSPDPANDVYFTRDTNTSAGKTIAAGSALFTDNSLLVVNAAGLNGAAAITSAATGELAVADNAKLLIAGGTAGTTVTVVKGFTPDATTATSEGWGIADVTKNLATNSDVLGIASRTFDPTTGTYTVTLAGKAPGNPYLDKQGNALLEEFGSKYGVGDVNHANKGVAYIARIVQNNDYLGNDSKAKAQALENPGKMALAGGTNKAGMGAALTAASASAARNNGAGASTGGQTPTAVSMSDGEVGLNAGNGMKNGVGVWLMPLYKWSFVNGVESGGFDSGYTSGLGGIALGVDYTLQDAFRIGVAFNVGTGYSNSTGDVSETRNNFDFWGLSLYAAYQRNNFGLNFDLGYTGVYNDMTQETDARLRWGSNEANTLTDVFTVGLTAQYTVELDVIDITPHVGVRYMGATTHGYDVEGQGGTLAEIDSDHQSVWYFPVGVTFSNDVSMDNGWTFTPKLDLGFIAAAGDLKADSSVRTSGFSTVTEYSMKTVDGFAFNGGLGFEVGNENIKFGLDYSLQASEHETGHMISGTFRYEF